MEQSKLLEARVQAKRKYNLLTEVHDLTVQMAQAMDRQDEVSLRMLLAMRGEAIEKLRVTEEVLRQQQKDVTDGGRLSALLRGEPPHNGDEKPLAEQVAVNKRLLKQVQELDKRLNLQMGRDKSFYHGRTG